MNRVIGHAAVLLTVVLVGCAVTSEPTHLYSQSDLDAAKRMSSVRTVVLTEPLVDITLHQLTEDPVPAEPERRHLASGLPEMARQELLLAGLSIAEAPAASRPLYRRKTGQWLDNFRRLLSADEDEEPQLPTLGPQVNLLTAPLQADAILLMRYRGRLKSDSLVRREQVSAVLLSTVTLGLRSRSGEPRDRGELELLLIDGISGDVLWAGMADTNTHDAIMTSQHLLQQMLAEVPY